MLYDAWLQGHNAVLLRTQYRCHPRISAISNNLFYNEQLIDGIGEELRQPLAVSNLLEAMIMPYAEITNLTNL